MGFDLNAAKIELYQQGIDPTREVGDEALKASTVEFTADETRLKEAEFHIVAVPTPVNDDHTPDLTREELEEVPLGTGGCQYRLGVNAHFIEDDGQLVYEAPTINGDGKQSRDPTSKTSSRPI